jgi:uncharacterized protein GlcG (DUF336 family)
MTTSGVRGVLGTYDTEIDQELAETGFRAAQAKAKEFGVPMSVAVVDKAGRPALFVRGDGRGAFSAEMVVGRTVAAAALRRRTCELGDTPSDHFRMQAYAGLVPGLFAPVPGATPVAHKGQVIGAVGCGGGTSAQDQECADAGAAAIEAAYAKRR